MDNTSLFSPAVEVKKAFSNETAYSSTLSQRQAQGSARNPSPYSLESLENINTQNDSDFNLQLSPMAFQSFSGLDVTAENQEMIDNLLMRDMTATTRLLDVMTLLSSRPEQSSRQSSVDLHRALHHASIENGRNYTILVQRDSNPKQKEGRELDGVNTEHIYFLSRVLQALEEPPCSPPSTRDSCHPSPSLQRNFVHIQQSQIPMQNLSLMDLPSQMKQNANLDDTYGSPQHVVPNLNRGLPRYNSRTRQGSSSSGTWNTARHLQNAHIRRQSNTSSDGRLAVRSAMQPFEHATMGDSLIEDSIYHQRPAPSVPLQRNHSEPNTETSPVLMSPSTLSPNPRRLSTANSEQAVPSLMAFEPSTALLREDYKRRPNPSKFFKVGRVFSVVWAEPEQDPGDTASMRSESSVSGKYGQHVFHKIRRRIDTHHGSGVAGQGRHKVENGIIYTGKSPPTLLPGEEAEAGEEGMQSKPVRVDPDGPGVKLSPTSRINYTKLYTVEYNLRVLSVGSVSRETLPHLLTQFQEMFKKGLVELELAEVVRKIKNKQGSHARRPANGLHTPSKDVSELGTSTN